MGIYPYVGLLDRGIILFNFLRTRQTLFNWRVHHFTIHQQCTRVGRGAFSPRASLLCKGAVKVIQALCPLVCLLPSAPLSLRCGPKGRSLLEPSHLSCLQIGPTASFPLPNLTQMLEDVCLCLITKMDFFIQPLMVPKFPEKVT